MSLYNAKTTSDHETLRISKFDGSLQHEASYLVGQKTCDCPAFAKRQQCKHIAMRTMFRMQKRVDSDHFLDYEKREWRRLEEIAVADGQMIIEQLTCDIERARCASVKGAGQVSGLSVPAPAPEVGAAPSGAPFKLRRL